MDGKPPHIIDTRLSGYELLNDPLSNKGTAFTEDERDALDLHGLLPPHVASLDLQVQRRLDARSARSAAICRNTCSCAACRIPTRRCSMRC